MSKKKQIDRNDIQRLDQLVRLQEEVNKLTSKNAELAKGLMKTIESLRYISGIAERGLERQQRDDETTESFILGYVQHLEAKENVLKDIHAICGIEFGEDIYKILKDKGF